MIAGILVGLVAASCQSVSYLFSRQYVTRQHHTGRELFALSHVWMGLIAVALLPALWSPQAPRLASYIWPLISIGLGALVAHWQFHHLEAHVPRGVFWRRVAAAALMTLAIATYMVSRNLHL